MGLRDFLGEEFSFLIFSGFLTINANCCRKCECSNPVINFRVIQVIIETNCKSRYLKFKFGNLFGLGYKKFIPHEYLSLCVNDMSVTELRRGLVEVRIK